MASMFHCLRSCYRLVFSNWTTKSDFSSHLQYRQLLLWGSLRGCLKNTYPYISHLEPWQCSLLFTSINFWYPGCNSLVPRYRLLTVQTYSNLYGWTQLFDIPLWPSSLAWFTFCAISWVCPKSQYRLHDELAFWFNAYAHILNWYRPWSVRDLLAFCFIGSTYKVICSSFCPLCFWGVV